MSIRNLIPLGGTIIGGAAGVGVAGATLYGTHKFVDAVAADKHEDHTLIKGSAAGIASTAIGIATYTGGSVIQERLTAPRTNGRIHHWYGVRDLKPMSNGAKAGTQLLKTAGGMAAAAGLVLTIGATVAMESGRPSKSSK
ncbi:MAG: hypothetical protein JWM86_2259 [Thermoleophilia bacterium]|nr:hypothetical protein [Thermoleophilia bacterium]